MSNNRIECLLVSDFTAGSLAGLMENSSTSPECHVAAAPFDQVAQVLLQTDHESWDAKPQVVVLWTRPERVSASLEKSLAGEAVSEQQVLTEVEAFCDLTSR